MSAKAYDKTTAAFAGYLIANIPGITADAMKTWMEQPDDLKAFLAGLELPLNMLSPVRGRIIHDPIATFDPIPFFYDDKCEISTSSSSQGARGEIYYSAKKVVGLPAIQSGSAYDVVKKGTERQAKSELHANYRFEFSEGLARAARMAAKQEGGRAGPLVLGYNKYNVFCTDTHEILLMWWAEHKRFELSLTRLNPNGTTPSYQGTTRVGNRIFTKT